MSDYDRLWLTQTITSTAAREVAQAIDRLGKALPCHVVSVTGAIVTVAFDVSGATLPQITIPKAESNWIRMPTQIGDKGVTMPTDVYLGGVSGLGGGTATTRKEPNLSPLIFVPVSNSGSPPIDQNKAQVQGPSGAIVQTSDGKVVMTLDESGLTFVMNGVTILTINSSGASLTGLFSATGDVVADNGANYISLQSHIHSGVQSGASDTGPPVAGT